MPVTYNVVPGTSCTTTGLATSTLCVTDAVNKRITITKFITATVTAGVRFEFTVDKIQNPGKYESPGNIEFYMQTADGGSIDSGAYIVPSRLYTASEIDLFTVVP